MWTSPEWKDGEKRGFNKVLISSRAGYVLKTEERF